ncbi:MAG: hypothetical protein O2816_13355 [Planctomycetota bacterium]|nr:hypothetical protein [Planctomycetota bacterium]
MIALLSLCTALAAAPSTAGAADDSAAVYRVAFSGARRRVVHIEATLPKVGAELRISPEGAETVEGRWSAFFQDLRAFDLAGQPVELKHEKDGSWSLSRRHAGGLQLTWKVDLQHDRKVEHRFGIDEVPYFRDDCVFIPTGALFLAPPELEDALVEFEIPDDWSVSAAWPPVAGESWVFAVADHDELCRSVVLVGEHTEVVVDAARAEWVIAVGEELAPHIDELADALMRAADEAEILFGHVPAARYLLVANRGRGTGGSARVGAMSLVLQFSPGTPYDHMWRYTLVHELVHMWNGVTLRRKDLRCEWFAEGVTDYVAALLLGRSGLADDAELLALLGHQLTRYRRAQGELSLADAGAQKHDHVDLIYAGGMWMGLLLDLELRQATKGEVALEDYFGTLMGEYDLERPYGLGDLEKVAERLGGGGMRRFFQRHVRGEQALPVEMYLARLGLEAGEVGHGRSRHFEITVRAESTEAQDRLRFAILGIE